MREWLKCPACGLDYRPRGSEGCPRCAKNGPPEQAGAFTYGSASLEPPKKSFFWLPVWLAGAALVCLGIGSVSVGARDVVASGLLIAGVVVMVLAQLWTLGVLWEQGLGWFLASFFIPLVALVGLIRARNLRPLALHLAGVFMFVLAAALKHPPS